jgi:uncharacterized membrane protein YedE/YeeE
MRRALAAALCGAVFGVGLALARMTLPTVVIGFLDVFGRFDPTLLFVLGAAVATTVLAFPFVLRRQRPLFAAAYELPTSRVIDLPLLLGAAIFGIGWGLAGYCPGPALVAFAAGVPSALVFVPAMLAGMLIQQHTRRR